MSENGNTNGQTEQLEQQEQPLYEAPASATARMYSPHGVNWLLTIRAHRAGEVIERANILEAALLAAGWTVNPSGSGDIAQAIKEAQPGKPLPLAAAGPAPATTPAPASGGQGLTFEAEKLAAEISQGQQARWKIYGGRFSKFGVTIWPEVLGETFNVDELDPQQVYQLDNYRATYVTNDKGNPSKVTRLEFVG